MMDDEEGCSDDDGGPKENMVRKMVWPLEEKGEKGNNYAKRKK